VIHAKTTTGRNDYFSCVFAIGMMDATCQPLASRTNV
jgi:hypothetical protein